MRTHPPKHSSTNWPILRISGVEIQELGSFDIAATGHSNVSLLVSRSTHPSTSTINLLPTRHLERLQIQTICLAARRCDLPQVASIVRVGISLPGALVAMLRLFDAVD